MARCRAPVIVEGDEEARAAVFEMTVCGLAVPAPSRSPTLEQGELLFRLEVDRLDLAVIAGHYVGDGAPLGVDRWLRGRARRLRDRDRPRRPLRQRLLGRYSAARACLGGT